MYVCGYHCMWKRGLTALVFIHMYIQCMYINDVFFNVLYVSLMSGSAGRQREAPSSPSSGHTRSPSKKQSQKKQRKKKYVPLSTSPDKPSAGPRRAAARQGAKSAREPSLMEIMDEQQAQEMGAEQYVSPRPSEALL